MYDLSLTLLVAQQAQRDPREYMPFLQSLNTLPPLRRKFQIDDHLNNNAKALDSLYALGAHDEVERYTVKHSLYRQALKLYRYQSEHLAKVTRLHVSYLTCQSHHLASAMASESVSDYSLASSSYAKCSPPRWREALHCAVMIQPSLPKEELYSLSRQLAKTLDEEQYDYRSAAQIHTDYLDSIPTAARLLCRGSYFAESQRLLSLHNLAEQIPDIVDVALAEKSGEISELMADCRSQLSAQLSRIRELRVKEAEDPLAFFGGDREDQRQDGDVADNISLAATDASTKGGQSLFTRYTGNQSGRFAGTITSNVSRHTSKTRRREERKRARGKKGSVYEQEYLVGSVRRLIDRVNGVHAEVGRLLEGLLRRGGISGMRLRADNVEEVMESVTSQCDVAVNDIWPVEGDSLAVDAEPDRDGVIRPPKGADAVYWESQMETRQRQSSQQSSDTRPLVIRWKCVTG
jgi:elongator complex protein 1